MATALFYSLMLTLILTNTKPITSQIPSISTSPTSQALPPDLMPILPSPKRGGAVGPPESSTLPIIPSSPSPPNPDAAEPHSAVAPMGPEAESAAGKVKGRFVQVSCGVLVVGFMWWLEMGLVPGV